MNSLEKDISPDMAQHCSAGRGEKERFEDRVTSSSLLIIAVDRNGKIEKIEMRNPTAERLFGWSEAKVLKTARRLTSMWRSPR